MFRSTLKKGRKLFSLATRVNRVTLTAPCAARRGTRISAHVSRAGVAIFRVGSNTVELAQLPEFLAELGCPIPGDCAEELAFAAELALPEIVSWRHDTAASMPDSEVKELLRGLIAPRQPRHAA